MPGIFKSIELDNILLAIWQERRVRLATSEVWQASCIDTGGFRTSYCLRMLKAI